jgi:hypothetical protein
MDDCVCGRESGTNPDNCERCQLVAEIERLREELHDAGDGDTWLAACGRCEKEIERLRVEVERLDAGIAERDEVISRGIRESDFLAAEIERYETVLKVIQTWCSIPLDVSDIQSLCIKALRANPEDE